jgi:FkbM family methyltransferase
MFKAVTNHPTFQAFQPWEGLVAKGFTTNAVGSKIDIEFLRGFGWATPETMADRVVKVQYEALVEDTFEWMAVFDALLEARGVFTMIELGAGFGRWLVTAVCAARIRRPDLRMRLIGVEAQHQHFEWMMKHFRDNGLDPAEHRLIEGAVAVTAGKAYLVEGADPSGFWGQYMTTDPNEIAGHVEGSYSSPVEMVTLAEVMQGESYVDLLDMDIQDAERTVVPANIRLLTDRVRRVHIETHWPETHTICDRALSDAGWRISHSFPPNSRAETEFGSLEIGGGGVLVATNPRLSRR